MLRDTKWNSRQKKHLLLKILVPILLLGIAYRIFITSDSIQASPETPLPDHIPIFNQSDINEEEEQELPVLDGKCDLFSGEWVPNPSGPEYTNETCPFIETHQNCMKNGRPDSAYLYWRWTPHGCDLPKFDPLKFLTLMRNKSWALIGDSITRNHVQSLLCMLSKADKVVEVYHDEEYKSRRWFVPLYNFTVSVVWSPFLVQAAIFEDMNGVASSEAQLHLDKLDTNWVNMYQNLDYMTISSGKWFNKTSIIYENNTILGCRNCPGKNLTELGVEFPYRKVLRRVLKFISTSNHKGTIFFRTSTPDHFENGEWSTGGTCQRKEPVKNGEIDFKELSRVLRQVELSEFRKVKSVASQNGVNLKLLDVAPLSLMRPDGHPGPYRYFYPFAVDENATVQNDCLHWCLPGPIDAWNDVLMEML
ncbi:unnamed protein product [Rhodiola kirilowii]